MSRFLCWSGVVLLVLTLSPTPQWAVSQVPAGGPFASNQEPPAQALPAATPVPAQDVPPPVAPAAPPAPIAPGSPIQVPTTVPTALSFPVVNMRDAAIHQKIEAALDATAEVDFNETPLAEIAAYMREAFKIPVIVDKRALDDVGMGGDTPVTFSLRGVSRRSVLKLILNDLDLTFVVRDEVLVITTPEEAENKLVKRVYAVADLAPELRPPLIVGVPSERYDAIVELITSVVAPDSWDEVGGAGSVEVFEPWSTLAVSQTWENHEALGALLVAVRKVQQTMTNAQVQEADCAPVRVVPELQTAAHAKIEQALDATTEFDFHEAPLQEVAQFLAKTHKIPVLIDRRALDDVGMGSDTPVTISLNGVSLRAALHHMVRELDLTYVITDEVLKITTPEDAEKNLQTLVYPIADLVTAERPMLAPGDSRCDDYDTLIETITSTIEPDSWDEVGGAGVIEPLSPWRLLAISQTEEAHDEIASFLQTMRQAHRATAFDPYAVPPVGTTPVPLQPGLPVNVPPAPAMPMGMGTGGPLGMQVPGSQQLVLKLHETYGFDIEQLRGVIQGAIAPETWGPAPSQGAIFPFGDRLLIRQSPEVHADIQEFIRELQISTFHGGMGGGTGGFF